MFAHDLHNLAVAFADCLAGMLLNVGCDMCLQPGYESLGFISCTGTNFLIRSRAFQDVRPSWCCSDKYRGFQLAWHGTVLKLLSVALHLL